MNPVVLIQRPVYHCALCPTFFCSSREKLNDHKSEHLRHSSLNPENPPTNNIPPDEMSKGHTDESQGQGTNDRNEQDAKINPIHERKSNRNGEFPVVPVAGTSKRDRDLDPGLKPYACKGCPKMFTTAENMEQHFDQNESHRLAKNDMRRRMKIRRKPGFTWRPTGSIKDRTCSYCGKVLSEVRNRKNHERIHLNQKPFSCTLCEMKFHSQSALLIHLRRVCNTKTNVKTKQVVKNSVKSDFNVNQNSTPKTITTTRVIAVGRQQKCHICHKILFNNGTLKSHMRIHTGEKPYKCKSCPKSFYSNHARYCHRVDGRCPGTGTGNSENLAEAPVSGIISIKQPNDIIRPNTNQQLEPNTCLYCYKKLANETTLGDHIRGQHTGEKPFQCHRCSEGFHAKKALSTHLLHQQLRCRRNKYILDRQGQGQTSRRPKKTNSKKITKMKLKELERECPHCGRICVRQETLEDHIRSQHTGETPFKCDDCGNGFHSQRTLYSHQMSYQGECKTRYKPSKRNYHHKGSLVPVTPAVNKLKIKIQSEVSEGTSIFGHNKTPTPRKITNQAAITAQGIYPNESTTTTASILPKKGIQPVEDFSCPYCKKLMSNRMNLIAHIRLHTGDRPFECSDCKARFFNLNTLNTHRENKKCLLLETQIKVEKPTMASNRKFASKSKPMAVIGPNHLQQQLSVKAKSPVASGSDNETRILPLRRGPGPLSRTIRAEVITPTPQGVISESGISETDPGHSTRYVCPLCEKIVSSEVNLENHIRLHTGEKPFSCLKCEATFYSQKSLCSHKRAGGTKCWQLKRRKRSSQTVKLKEVVPTTGPGNSSSASSAVTIGLRKNPGLAETRRKIETVGVERRKSSRALTDAELEIAINAESDGEQEEVDKFKTSRKISLRARPSEKRPKYVEPTSEDDNWEDHETVIKTNGKEINQSKNTKFLGPATARLNARMSVSNNLAHASLLNNSTNGKSCPFCQQTYSTDILLEHIRVQHLNDRPFQCILCDASFQLHAELLNHKVDFHRISCDKVE